MRSVATVIAAALLLAGCGSNGEDVRGSRAPDAVGTVTSVASGATTINLGFAPDPGYEYFEGTTFAFDATGGLVDDAGETVVAADVSVGERVEVWVEACAESFPVQCADPVGRLLP